MKTRKNNNTIAHADYSLRSKTHSNNPHHKPTSTPHDKSNLIIPTPPTISIKSKPTIDPLAKNHSQPLTANLLVLQPLEKEETIREWVQSQRNIQTPPKLIRQNTPNASVSPPIPLAGETNEELELANESAKSQSILQLCLANTPTPERAQNGLITPIINQPIPDILNGLVLEHGQDQRIVTPNRDQHVNPLETFNSRSSQISPSSITSLNHVRKSPSKIDQAPSSQVFNQDPFSVPDERAALDSIQIKEANSGLIGSDPFGFIQTERELVRAASTSREQTDVDNTSGRLNQINLKTSPSKSSIIPDTQIQAQNHQESDLSLGDLLNINRNKKNRSFHTKKVTTIKKITPKNTPLCSSVVSCSASSSPSPSKFNKGYGISQSRKRHPRKAKQTSKKFSRDQKSGQALETDESLHQVESKVTSPEAEQNFERTNELINKSNKSNKNNQSISPMKKSKRTSKQKKRHSSGRYDENSILTPVVVINNSKIRNLRNRNVLKPKLNQNQSQINRNQTSRNKSGLDSKPSNRKRSKDKLNQLDEKNPGNDKIDNDQDTPPSRKARLRYYKSLDDLTLEEEIII